MSTSKKDAVEKLEVEIKEYEDKHPCLALQSSLLYLKAMGWLPKPETQCKTLVQEHAQALDTCTSFVRGRKQACKKAYRLQMEAARCEISGILDLDQNGVPTSLRLPNEANRNWGLAQKLAYGTKSLFSPNPFVRYFQEQGYMDEPGLEMNEMSLALNKSYQLHEKCQAYKLKKFQELKNEIPKRAKKPEGIGGW